MGIDKDSTLMLSQLTLLTQVEKNNLDKIYARLMIGEESKEIIKPPFDKTTYIPIKNISNDLYLIFCKKKGDEPSYLDMVALCYINNLDDWKY